MKKVLFFVLLLTIIVSAQDKYLIKFKDKGPVVAAKGAAYKTVVTNVLNTLSERAIERRSKTVGSDAVEDIITYEDLPVYEGYLKSLADNNINVEKQLNWFNSVSVYLNSTQLGVVKNMSFVESVKTVRGMKFKDETPFSVAKINNDNNIKAEELSAEQNSFIGVDKLHEKGITGTGALIGVLDTGFKWSGQNVFANTNIVGEHDFVFNDSVTENEEEDVISQHSHGTYVFSIVGGYEPQIFVGMAYDASFLLAKTENVSTEIHLEEDNYAAAMEWMENQGVDVTTSSLGYSEFDPGEGSYTYEDMDGETTIVTQAAEIAFSKGVVVVTSAGNEGNSAWQYITAPADGKNVIAVGAVTVENFIAGFSSQGPTYDGRVKPDVCAPGVQVAGVNAGTPNTYRNANGTSSAAPFIGGICGLLVAENPMLNNRQVRVMIHEASDRVGDPDELYGYGSLNAVDLFNYPIVYMDNSAFKLKKMFIDDAGIDESVTPTITYSVNAGNWVTAPLAKIDSIRYTFDLSTVSVNDTLRFSFTYKPNDSGEVTVPESDYYTVVAGENIVNFITATEDEIIITDDYTLYQNYPNPFNGGTNIQFAVPVSGDYNLKLYNILGEEVATLFNGNLNKGVKRVQWNPDSYIPSGVYFYSLSGNGVNLSRKMIYLK